MGRQKRTNVIIIVNLLASGIALILSGFGGERSGYPRLLLGSIASKNSRQIENSPWGIQIGTFKQDHVARAADIGVKWTRLNASWRDIEKAQGVYDWDQTDEVFSFAVKQGITPFVCLAGSNRLYCKEGKAETSSHQEIYGRSILPPTKDPVALEAWLAFVRAAVERYKAIIRYWEVWNEPNHPHYWGAAPDGSEYGLLLRKTAETIKRIDPSAKVVGGALASLDPQFTEDFLANGSAEFLDIISFHNYASLPEERIYKAAETWKVIEKYKPTLELWQGECGYPSHSSTRDYRGTSPWGLRIQAKWLLRQSFTDVYFCRTSLSNYFKLVHEGGRGEKPQRSSLTALDSVLGFPDRGGSRVKSVGVNEKCVLTNPGLEPKPAYFAYQNLCATFDSRYTPVVSDASIVIEEPGIFYGIGAEDDAFPSIPLVAVFKSLSDNHLAAYWLPWHPQELIQEGRITFTARNTQFRNPVLVDLMEGTVYSISFTLGENGEQRFANMPLADYPFVIAEREEIELLP